MISMSEEPWLPALLNTGGQRCDDNVLGRWQLVLPTVHGPATTESRNKAETQGTTSMGEKPWLLVQIQGDNDAMTMCKGIDS